MTTAVIRASSLLLLLLSLFSRAAKAEPQIAAFGMPLGSLAPLAPLAPAAALMIGYPAGGAQPYPAYPAPPAYASAYPYFHHHHGPPFGWHGFHGGYGHHGGYGQHHGYHHPHHAYHGPPMPHFH
ncbi:protein kreg-1-like [Frankliniella occidentalis]|uniref:Protein kreg-1-like n=1 Tax=Frankliniella occidentalis TaxID=133901 RepID=A0A6J1TLV8_FRAOC|nr:protein kreg-1-like [Frankliniella occidentalis]